MSKFVVKANNGCHELHKADQVVLYAFNSNGKQVLQDIADANEKGGLKTPYAEVHQFKAEGYFLLKQKGGLSVKVFYKSDIAQELLSLVTQVKRQLPPPAGKVDKTPIEPT